jgi:hypothetical protein
VRGNVGRAPRNVSLDGRTASNTGQFTIAVRETAVRSVCVTELFLDGLDSVQKTMPVSDSAWNRTPILYSVSPRFKPRSETLGRISSSVSQSLRINARIKVKCKAVPLQAWSGPEGSRKLRFPDFMTTAQDGGKVVSRTTYQLKGKAVPLQAWSGPEGSRKLRSPDFMTAQDGSTVVSLTHRPPLPPGNTPSKLEYYLKISYGRWLPSRSSFLSIDFSNL